MAQHAHSILLVDDDRFLLDMYSMKMKQEGHTVQACLSVQDAIRAIEGGFKPDVIVFDLVMPQDDGFEFLEILKEKRLAADATLVALTNQSSDEDRERAKALGADEYIVKATTVPSEVVNMINDAIERHHKA